MIKEQRKYCYGVYTLMFLLMCIGAFLPFFTEGKSFVWGAGVEDGLSQHFSALAYYGEALREFFRNLLPLQRAAPKETDIKFPPSTALFALQLY